MINSEYNEYEVVLNQIINLISTKGVVNSNDIEQIIKEYNIEAHGEHSMGPIHADIDGVAFVVP
jgi:hypothetical protein